MTNSIFTERYNRFRVLRIFCPLLPSVQYRSNWLQRPSAPLITSGSLPAGNPTLGSLYDIEDVSFLSSPALLSCASLRRPRLLIGPNQSDCKNDATDESPHMNHELLPTEALLHSIRNAASGSTAAARLAGKYAPTKVAIATMRTESPSVRGSCVSTLNS